MAAACRCPRGQQRDLYTRPYPGPNRQPSVLAGHPFLLFPNPPDKGKEPIPSSPGQGNKNVEGYDPGGPGPPSSPSSPKPVLTPASSGSLRPTLTQPTLVSLRKASTASVDFSFHNHLPEGALGCFHSWAFPISFHSRLICGIQALHSVKRWWRVCLPPHTTSTGSRLSCGPCPSGRARSPHGRMHAHGVGTAKPGVPAVRSMLVEPSSDNF